ncbi:MAG: DMT family transporter [Microbacteriaceae bacterium]|nr:DMT family transporter [Microbacteriaceae bacterium]
MLTVIVGSTAALIFGAADFLGGLASKRISPIQVTVISALAGLAVLFAASIAIPGRWSSEALLFGGLSGIAGAIAISLLYACLAIGPMSILSPLTALVSAFIPLLAGAIRGERLTIVGYIAIGVALVAVVLVGFVKDEEAVRPSLKALLMAIGSGAAIGAFMILIDLTPADAGLVPLIANRAVNGALMLVVAVAVIAITRVRTEQTKPRTRRVDWRKGLWIAVACGTIDATANALLLLGLRLGELSVMSVLTALYPAGTIILAAFILRERISLTQWIGLVLALVAAGMLALA